MDLLFFLTRKINFLSLLESFDKLILQIFALFKAFLLSVFRLLQDWNKLILDRADFILKLNFSIGRFSLLTLDSLP